MLRGSGRTLQPPIVGTDFRWPGRTVQDIGEVVMIVKFEGCCASITCSVRYQKR